jgi:hypothetical protein
MHRDLQPGRVKRGHMQAFKIVAISCRAAIALKRLDLTPCPSLGPRFFPCPLFLQIIKTASVSRESKRDWHG